jgi:leucine-zipper of insertion element IS481
MKLHANAALSLKGRRELCRRVVEGERTLTEAAEAAGVSVRCARKWVGRSLGSRSAQPTCHFVGVRLDAPSVAIGR